MPQAPSLLVREGRGVRRGSEAKKEVEMERGVEKDSARKDKEDIQENKRKTKM